MYIEKSINTSFGIPAICHVLKDIHIYFDQGISHVDIAGYFNNESLSNNSQAVIINQVELQQTQFSNCTEIYNAILQSELFNGGILHE